MTYPLYLVPLSLLAWFVHFDTGSGQRFLCQNSVQNGKEESLLLISGPSGTQHSPNTTGNKSSAAQGHLSINSTLHKLCNNSEYGGRGVHGLFSEIKICSQLFVRLVRIRLYTIIFAFSSLLFKHCLQFISLDYTYRTMWPIFGRTL